MEPMLTRAAAAAALGQRVTVFMGSQRRAIEAALRLINIGCHPRGRLRLASGDGEVCIRVLSRRPLPHEVLGARSYFVDERLWR